MVTHHLDNEEDFREGGYFADDFGRLVCRWLWHAENTTLEVRSESFGRSINLSEYGNVSRLSDDELMRRLIDIAKSTGEDLRGKPFEQ